jgi:ribonuclease J
MPEIKKTAAAEAKDVSRRRGRGMPDEKKLPPKNENSVQKKKSADSRRSNQPTQAAKRAEKSAEQPRKKAPRPAAAVEKPAESSAGARAAGGDGKNKDTPRRAAGSRGGHAQKSRRAPAAQDPVRIIPLGGLGEIGKNMTLIEYGGDILIVDCGFAFPGDDLPGVDYVLPDFSYVIKNKEKIRGVVVTHGHEDHIGALSYLLKEINPPIYSARLTIGLIEGKLREHGLLRGAQLNTVKAGDIVKLGAISCEFIAVNHSIPDAFALAITTPAGIIVHTGDYKIDYTPIDGVMINLARFGELGRKGVLALLSDSTNAEKPGITPSERRVGESLDSLFAKAKNRRIIVASFSSNIHRIQQVMNAAANHERRVVISGRSMENVTAIASQLGYLKLPPEGLLGIDEMGSFDDGQIVIITTGSQGEPMSALTRMARGDHRKISVTSNDYIVISAMPIPGNERSVGNVINELMKLDAEVVYENNLGIHVSGHACREEIKTMIGLIKPKYFIPVHGEYKHLIKNRDIAAEMGISPGNIVVGENGDVIEMTQKSLLSVNTVPAGSVLVDGIGVGDVGNVVLRDRKLLSEDGLIVVAVSIDAKDGSILSGPQVVSRGFVYVKESEELMTRAAQICRRIIEGAVRSPERDVVEIKQLLKEQLGGYLFGKTRRRPVVLPIVQEIAAPPRQN